MNMKSVIPQRMTGVLSMSELFQEFVRTRRGFALPL